MADAAFPPRFTVGGKVNGLIGNTPGITLQTAGSTTSIEGNGVSSQTYDFAFPYLFRTDETYNVSVTTYPVSGSAPQLCDVHNGQGRVDNSDITDIIVNCVDGEWITVNATGLLGDELRIQRTEAGGRTDIVSLTGGTTTKDFPTPSTLGVNNSFVILRQPQSPYQDCTLGNPGPGHITTQTVSCTTRSFDLKASIQGLTNPGLVLDVNGSTVTVKAGTSSMVLDHLDSGTVFNVSVDTQPIGQSCSLLSAAGTIGNADHTVLLQCVGTGLAIGGAVAGLDGTGLTVQLVGSSTALETVVVNNGSTAYIFSTTATAGDSYQIKISGQPTSNWQECVFSATGTDTITIGPLTGSSLDNGITCTTRTFPVNVSVTGLTLPGNMFTLVLNGEHTVDVSADGLYSFPAIPSGTDYTIRIQSFKSGYYCELTGSHVSGQFTGSVTNASITVPVELTNCIEVANTAYAIYDKQITISGCNHGGCETVTGSFDAPPGLNVSAGGEVNVTVRYSRSRMGSALINITSILHDPASPAFFYDGSCPGAGDTSCINPDHFKQLVCDTFTERSYIGAPVAFREKTFALRLPNTEYGPFAIRIESGPYYCTGGWGFTVLDLFKANQGTGLKLADVQGES